MTARIGWPLTANYSVAAHPPKVTVNGSSGYETLTLSALAGADSPRCFALSRCGHQFFVDPTFQLDALPRDHPRNDT